MFGIKYQVEGRAQQKYFCRKSSCTIGRSKSNDVVLKHWRIGKQHAVIELDQKGVVVRDLDSNLGTWVNRERIERYGPLDITDEIVIGNCKFWVDAGDAVKQVTPQADNVVTLSQAHTAAHSKIAGASGSVDALEMTDSDRNHGQMLSWRKQVHDRLVEQMDLRRKDLYSMSDEQVRSETEAQIDEILEGVGDDLPTEIDKQRLRTDVLNEAIGLGPLETLLADDSITEIMVNRHEQIFVERKGRLELSDCTFTSDHAVLAVIDRIITPIGRRIDESSPMVDARLKDGSRVNAIIPPLAIHGPSLTIRRFSKKTFTFEDLVGFGSISPDMAEFLDICIKHKRNVIVSGGTGTGKTTLLNVLSGKIPKRERIVTVEDAAELRLDQPNLVSLESRPPNLEGRGQITIRDLVRNALRMRPDRIVVGECRGGEALDMLQAMNTGHDGSLTTIHANSPRDALSRLEVMVLMAGMDLPVTAIREQTTSAVNLIVQITRFPSGERKVTYVTEVTGMESGIIQLQDIFLYKQAGHDENGNVVGQFAPTGFIPSFYEELEKVGIPVKRDIFQKGEALHA